MATFFGQLLGRDLLPIRIRRGLFRLWFVTSTLWLLYWWCAGCYHVEAYSCYLNEPERYTQILLSFPPASLLLYVLSIFIWRGFAAPTNHLKLMTQQLNVDLTNAGAKVTTAAPPSTSKMRATFIPARRKD